MDMREMKRIEQDQLESLVREAQAQRDRELKELIVRGAKALAKFFRTVGEAIREAADAQRIGSWSQSDRRANRY